MDGPYPPPLPGLGDGLGGGGGGAIILVASEHGVAAFQGALRHHIHDLSSRQLSRSSTSKVDMMLGKAPDSPQRF